MNTVIETVRKAVRACIVQIAKILNKLTGGKLSPAAITLTSAIAHVPIAWLIASQRNGLAAILLLIFGLFDALDGSLARLQGSQSKSGMLLDSATDRVKEVLLYAGAAYAAVAGGNEYWAVWAVLACGGAFLVSYSNAWGEAVTAQHVKTGHRQNQTYRSGLMSFDVRLCVFLVGLVTGKLVAATVIIAIGSFYTAIVRYASINRALNNVQD